MANKDAAFGLRPSRMMGGAPFSGGQSRYRIASGYSTKIFQGDLVVVTTAGNIEKYNNTNNSAGLSTAAVGVFNGVFYTDPTTQKPTYGNYYPGSIVASDITAFVVDDPDAVFLANADEAFTRADLFRNYAVTNTTGVTQTGISKAMLDVSNSGTTVSFVLQAIDICQDPDNSDTTTSNANILVRINHHQYRSRTGI